MSNIVSPARQYYMSSVTHYLQHNLINTLSGPPLDQEPWPSRSLAQYRLAPTIRRRPSRKRNARSSLWSLPTSSRLSVRTSSAWNFGKASWTGCVPRNSRATARKTSSRREERTSTYSIQLGQFCSLVRTRYRFRMLGCVPLTRRLSAGLGRDGSSFFGFRARGSLRLCRYSLFHLGT